MSKFKNLATQRFGKLVALYPIERIYEGSWEWLWLVACDCGVIKKIAGKRLTHKRRHVKSCGCLRVEWSRDHGVIHRKSGTPIHNAYMAMRSRCTNPNATKWKDYGGRGIRCEFTSFEEFYAEVGDRPGPGYSIDRIDTNGNYAPGNIRWATMQTQNNNKRSNDLITFRGETRNLTAWARILGIGRLTLGRRIRAGWNIDRAFLIPVA